MSFFYGVTDENFKLTLGNKRYLDNDRPVYENTSVKLVAAKNDTAVFQIVLKSEQPYLLNVSEQPVFSRKGSREVYRLAADSGKLALSLFPIGMMQDNQNNYQADVLLRYPVLEVEEDTPVSVWAEITIPSDTPAGEYRGSVTIYKSRMFEDETAVGKVDYTLEVKEFVMPDPSQYAFHLDLWQHNSNIARQAETPLWSDAHFAMIEPVVETLSKMGQKAVTIIASEIPWSGQRGFNERRSSADFYEYSILSVRKKGGRFEIDFTAMQRYIDLCAKYGIDREIEVFGLANIWTEPKKGFGGVASDYPDALRIRYLDEDGTYKYMKTAEEIDEYIRALEAYFIRTGQISKVRVVADEPEHVEEYAKSIGHLHEIAPSFRFKAALNHTGFIDRFGDLVDDFAPALFCIQQEYAPLVSLMDKLREGKRYLWYVCCLPEHPNTFLHSPMEEGRLIGWMTHVMGLDGFLRWSYTCWTDKPREDIRFFCWPAGDVNFIYPSGDKAPLLSLRWKALARGIQEFELLRLARERGENEAADKAISLVFGQEASSLLPSGDSQTMSLDGIYRGEQGSFYQAKCILLDALK